MSIEEAQTHPRRVKIKHKESVYDGPFGNVERYDLRYELFNGEMARLKTEIANTTDSVAILLFDRTENEIVLCEQFRFATFANGRRKGWILETFVGNIENDETADKSVVRDVAEDLGITLDSVTPIATFFCAPDRLTQRIFLYYAEGHCRRQREDDDEDEDIRLYRIRPRKFFEKLARGEFEDPKVVVAGQWMQAQRAEKEELSETVAYKDSGNEEELRGEIARLREEQRELRADIERRREEQRELRAELARLRDEEGDHDGIQHAGHDSGRRKHGSFLHRALIGGLLLVVLILLVVVGLILSGQQ